MSGGSADVSMPEAPGEASGAARARRDAGARVKQWVLTRQPNRGKRPRCARCREAIDDGGYRCTPKNQTSGCYVHPECLPTLGDQLQLHQGADVSAAEVLELARSLRAPPLPDPALPIAESPPAVPAPPQAAPAVGGGRVHSGSTDGRAEGPPVRAGTSDGCGTGAAPAHAGPSELRGAGGGTGSSEPLPGGEAAWWEARPWVPAALPCGQTAVQVPRRHRAAYLELKTHLLQEWAAAKGRGDAKAQWKALLHIDQMLMAKPQPRHATEEGGATQAALLEKRLRWAWAGEWELIVEDASEEKRVAPAAAPSAAQRARSLAGRVSTLAAAGEKGRALAAAGQSAGPVSDSKILRQLRELFPPAEDEDVVMAGPDLDDGICVKAAEMAKTKMMRPSRLSAPGVVGGRAEHWDMVAGDPVAGPLLQALLRDVACGDVPEEVLETLKTCAVVCLAKGGPGGATGSSEAPPGGVAGSSETPPKAGIRPILLSPVLRRYALQGVVKALQEHVAEAVGPLQFGVGTSGGAEAALLAVRLAMLDHEKVAIALDTAAAFQNVSRGAAFAAADEHLPQFAPFLRAWYSRGAEHLWRDDEGTTHAVPAAGGFDQGDPLAPLAFSLATRGLLEDTLRQLREFAPSAVLVAYLDDCTVVVPREHALRAWAVVCRNWAAAGLRLNQSKCGAWSPAGPGLHGHLAAQAERDWALAAYLPRGPGPEAAPAAGPSEAVGGEALRGSGPSEPMEQAPRDAGPSERGEPGFPPQREQLPLLGAHLRTQGDAEDSPFHLGAQDGHDLDQATARLRSLWDKLVPLMTRGLRKHVSGGLLRLYAGAASQYALRLGTATEAAVQRYDEALRGVWDQLLGRVMTDEDWQRACLPTRDGGLGIQSAGGRVHAAAWAGLVAALPEASRVLPGGREEGLPVRPSDPPEAMAEDLPVAQEEEPEAAAAIRPGHPSLAVEALMRDDALRVRAQRTCDALREQGATHAPLRLDLHTALGQPVKQKALSQQVNKAAKEQMLGSLPAAEQAFFRSAGGTGAGAFLEGPPTADLALPDELWETACRFRLGMRAAAHRQLPGSQGVCQHRARTGVPCGKALDMYDVHAVHCLTGGGTQARHDAMGRVLGSTVQEVLGVRCQYEQRVPQLDRMTGGELERAVMDVVYQDPDLGTQFIDVSVVSARAGVQARVMTAARREGHAAERACALKKARYGEAVLPFVLELGGRPSGPAMAWVRTLVARAGEDSEMPLLGAQVWGRISCTLQRYVALQLRRAAGL